jgi:hypothetical protein
MDKKTISLGLLALSLVAVLLAAWDFLTTGAAPLGLGADSWVLVAILLAVYGTYVKSM